MLIALAVVLVYWPLSSFTYGLTEGDTLDCWMPWRWFIASAMQDGHFPLWNPYAQSGYPIYADLQGPAWYPLSMALAGTVGHGLYTLQLLFLGYVVAGGIGMMRLVRQLHGDARVALVIGLAYALSGFFTAHQMHFYAVISAAWLPWLITAQLRLIARPAWRPALEAAVFQALLLTGGNHTFTLIGTWLLLALIAARSVRAWRQGDRSGVLRLFGFQALFAALSLVMACGTLYALVEVSPFLARAGGMPHADAAVNPFTWQAAWSYLFPYAVGTDPAWLGTDAAMANGYFGVIVLLLAALALFRKRTVEENVIGAFGLLCGLASFGAELPVHRWLWSAVPGLDLFRFPSYYQWFVALAAAVLAAGTLAQWPVLMARRPRLVKAVIGGGLLLVLLALGAAGLMQGHEPPFGQGDTLIEQVRGLGRWRRVLFLAPVTLLALAGLLWWALSARRAWWALVLLVVLEMGWATTWAQWNTALSDYAPAMLQGRIDELPQGPVWPELTPMAGNADGSATLKHIWRNVQNFEGRPSHDGFNSFWLDAPNQLAAEHAGLFAAMKRQPVAYLTDSLVPLEAYDPVTVDPDRDSALVVLPAGVRIEVPLQHRPDDRLEVAGFDHDGIILATRTGHPLFLVLQQAWYPGWTATVDGVPVELHGANAAMQGIVLPAGTHEVEFRFRKPVVPWLLGLSLFAFLGACVWLAFTRPPSVSSTLLRAAVAGLALAIGWSLFGHAPKAEHLPRSVRAWQGVVADHPAAHAPMVLNTDRYRVLAPLFEGRTVVPVRAEERSRLGTVLRAMDQLGDGARWWMDAGLPTAPAVRAALLHRYRVDTVLAQGEATGALLVPDERGLDAALLHTYAPEGGKWLQADLPWTPAFRMPAAELLAHAPGYLVVQASYRAAGAAVPMIVIERRRSDRITDYASFPLPAADAAGTAYVVQHLRELRHADEEVGVYVWNNGPDSVLVQGFSVEVTQRDLSAW